MKKEETNWNLLSQNRNSIMGVATLMIVFYHLFQMSNLVSGVIQGALMTLCSGVEIFIVLTGIGSYYSFEKKKDIKSFYAKRLKTVYLTTIIITLPYAIWWQFFSYGNKNILLFFVNWLLPNYAVGYAREVWYVPFILVMYALYPLVRKILFSDKIYKYRFLIVGIFSILWYVVYFVLMKTGNAYFKKIEIGYFRFPIFLFACLIGELVYKKKSAKIAFPIMAILSVILFAIFYVFSNDNNAVAFSRVKNSVIFMLYLVIITLFFKYVKSDFITKFFNFFSKISLELYLVHLLVFQVLSYYGIVDWKYYLLAILVSIPVSYLLSFFRRNMSNPKISSSKTA